MVQSVSTKRIMVGVTAHYAVLLWSVAVCAIRAAGFNFFKDVTCLQDVGTPRAPPNDLPRHHGVCYLLACAASGFTAIVIDGVYVVFAALLSSSVVFAKTQDTIVRSPLRFFFSARGPP